MTTIAGKDGVKRWTPPYAGKPARILAAADVVEAVSSHRPYRPGHGDDAAVEEIAKNRSILYDENAVDACLRLFKEKGFRFE